MEFGGIEREIFVDASPDVVFDVVSRPEHVRQWWPDDATYEPTPRGTGQIVFGVDGQATVESFTVVECRPPRTFSFRWTHPAGEEAGVGNSLLVTFELIPAGGGTRVRMIETGFRERGWEAALLEEQYHAHETGWDFYLPRLAPYLATLGTGS
ncbi:uncharacterized protein YndB with AHSA1/START domain [Nakamurella sp. UYEF19]|uniref:SRPBCC family protein n=1 Tax=Nakamurella sp. UYEF19 TaxID=1756392 RepID=UPI003394483E